VSATGRSDVRDPDDNYATPAWLSKAIFPHLRGKVLLDPSCGKGAILEAWNGPAIGLELDQRRAAGADEICQRQPTYVIGDVLCMNALESEGVREWRGDFVCDNPPFRLAMEFIQTALVWSSSKKDVAFLLRLSFLASQKRSDFHKKYPCDVFVPDRRPEFCASLKCTGKKDAKDVRKPGCGWYLVQELDAPRPRKCPDCGCVVQISTSDNSDYGWFVWGPGRGNRWFPLDTDHRLTLPRDL
jgi:hypothetical protein